MTDRVKIQCTHFFTMELIGIENTKLNNIHKSLYCQCLVFLMIYPHVFIPLPNVPYRYIWRVFNTGTLFEIKEKPCATAFFTLSTWNSANRGRILLVGLVLRRFLGYATSRKPPVAYLVTNIKSSGRLCQTCQKKVIQIIKHRYYASVVSHKHQTNIMLIVHRRAAIASEEKLPEHLLCLKCNAETVDCADDLSIR